jgi:transcriptional regulator with XRE-family HTH domain
MTLGEKIAALRKEAGMTQNQLSQELNLSAQAISKWENDLAEPDITMLKRLAEIFNTTVSDIVGEGKAAEENSTSNCGGETRDNGLYKVMLSYVSLNGKLATIMLLRDMYGFGIAEAKNIIDNLPYVLSYTATEEQYLKLRAKFSEVNAGVICEPAGTYFCKKCGKVINKDNICVRDIPLKEELCIDCASEIAEKNAQQAEAAHIAEKKCLKLRFIKAHIVSGSVGVILAVICMLIGVKDIWDVLIGLAVGVVFYCGIFMCWYKTIVRFSLFWIADIFSAGEGCFALIGTILLTPVYLALIIAVFLISPFLYPFSLVRRIRRMRAGDERDDPDFFDEYNEKGI